MSLRGWAIFLGMLAVMQLMLLVVAWDRPTGRIVVAVSLVALAVTWSVVKYRAKHNDD